MKTMQLVDRLGTDSFANVLPGFRANPVNPMSMNVSRIHAGTEQNVPIFPEDSNASALPASTANFANSTLDSASRTLVELEETASSSIKAILAIVILDFLEGIVRAKLRFVFAKTKNTNAPLSMEKLPANVLREPKVKTVTNPLIFALVKIHVKTEVNALETVIRHFAFALHNSPDSFVKTKLLIVSLKRNHV